MLSIIVLVGVSVTGVWQFFAHESDPNWYAYTPGSGFTVDRAPSTGMAVAHGFFGDASIILALAGSGWFAFRIAHSVPRAAVVAFSCAVVGAGTGGLIRYNILKLGGQTFEEASPGYWQLFTTDLEYAVTDGGSTGATAFRLLTLVHIITVPILVAFGWGSIQRALDRRTIEIQTAPRRTWHLMDGDT